MRRKTRTTTASRRVHRCSAPATRAADAAAFGVCTTACHRDRRTLCPARSQGCRCALWLWCTPLEVDLTERCAACAAARTTKKAATTAGPSGRGVLVRGTPARKKKALRRRAADDGEPEWDDAPDSESEEEVPAESSDNDEDALPDAGDARDDEDDDDDDAVPESPAPRRAVTPARGALVRLPPRALASAQRSRLASPVSLTQSQRTPSVAEPVRAFTPHAPHAPPRWRLKGTVRVPTEVCTPAPLDCCSQLSHSTPPFFPRSRRHTCAPMPRRRHGAARRPRRAAHRLPHPHLASTC